MYNKWEVDKSIAIRYQASKRAKEFLELILLNQLKILFIVPRNT